MSGQLSRVISADPSDADIDAVAERAMRFARETNTPMAPESFHVWYVYASRKNEAINKAIDLAMNTGARLTRVSLMELYQAHVAERTFSDELAAFSSSLSGAISDISGTINQGITDSNAVGGDLRQVKRGLGFNASRQELVAAVGSLMKATQTQLGNGRKLEIQLERSKTKVASLERELTELRKTVSVDHLTKLPNRRRFDLLLGEAIFNARQRNSALSLVIADLDAFGPINEKWGHDTGDNVLRYFATNLIQNLKGKDIVARYGGEEFVLLFTDLSLPDTLLVAEKLRKSFSAINWTSQQTGAEIGSITASFGATMLLPADTRESFIARAERLVLEAKRAGKNRTHGA